MFARVLVGFDGRAEGEDALALGRALTAPGGRVMAACQYRRHPHGAGGGESGHGPEDLHDDARASLARLPEGVEGRAAPGASPARTLHHLAEEERPDVLVVGSSRRATPARALLGGTAERLLHGSPCPVAVAPRGYRDHAHPPERIAVAYYPEDDADAAVRVAEALALAAGADVHAIVAFEPGVETMIGPHNPDYVAVSGRAHHRLERVVAARLEAASTTARIEARIVDGHPPEVLRQAAGDLDLLILGSRAYGPAGRVLMGSVIHRLLAHGCPCPVLVIPRGAGESTP